MQCTVSYRRAGQRSTVASSSSSSSRVVRRLISRTSPGQSLTELALALPILLLLLGFAGDLARVYFINTQMTNAAREGALWAGHHYGDSSVTSPNDNSTGPGYVLNIMSVVNSEESTPLLQCPPGQMTVTVTPVPGTDFLYPGGGTRQELTIQVDCVVPAITALISNSGSFHLTTKVTTFAFN